MQRILTTTTTLSTNATTIVLKLESLTQAGIITIMAVAIVVTNALVIATFLNYRGPSEVINCYLLSLAVADLLCGLLVVPLSIYPAIERSWYGIDKGRHFENINDWNCVVCRLVGYLEVTLWAVTVYTFMWISVDRYLAARKPLRYEILQTKTRCQCWMVFTWISAALLCCPPLFEFPKPDLDAFICMLDWRNMAAYSITLSILILGPSLITIIYAYTYIFHMLRKLRSGAPLHDKEYATALSENLSNPSHMMSFVLIMSFWLSWAPYIGVCLYESVVGELKIPFLHFGIAWLGFLNSFCKPIILITLSPQFRLALRIFCMTICCRYKGRMQAELIGMEPDD